MVDAHVLDPIAAAAASAAAASAVGEHGFEEYHEAPKKQNSNVISEPGLQAQIVAEKREKKGKPQNGGGGGGGGEKKKEEKKPDARGGGGDKKKQPGALAQFLSCNLEAMCLGGDEPPLACLGGEQIMMFEKPVKRDPYHGGAPSPPRLNCAVASSTTTTRDPEPLRPSARVRVESPHLASLRRKRNDGVWLAL